MEAFNKIFYIRATYHTRLQSSVTSGHPTEVRTPIATVKGWCPKPIRRWGDIMIHLLGRG